MIRNEKTSSAPPHSDPLAEPRALVDALLEERLSDAQAQRLGQLLTDRDDVVRFYIESIHQHYRVVQYATSYNESALLREAQGQTSEGGLGDTMYLPAIREEETLQPAPPVAAASMAGPRWATATPRGGLTSVSRRWWIGTAAAIALLVLGMLARQLGRPRQQPTPLANAAPVSLAILSAESDAQWSDERPRANSAKLTAGPLELTSGGVRLLFLQGTEVIVHGPARFELQSPASIRLLAGKLTAEVDHGAIGGFTVNTPSASVVDLGTEFGVSVAASGSTETQVLRGRVQIEPRAPGALPVILTENHGARVEPDSTRVVDLPAATDQFLHELTLIDLADIVAGGDGRGHARGAGINVADGSRQPLAPPLAGYNLKGDGKFRQVAGMPLVAGVFIPLGGNQPSVLDPAGHSFSGFPRTNGMSWYWLWAGGPVPYQNQPQQNYQPAIIGGRDFSTGAHSCLFMHASKGITFDLSAMRAKDALLNLTRFRAVCQNTAGPAHISSDSANSDFWVFVDGRLGFKRSPILLNDPPFDVRVDLSASDHFLTLVSTDGGDGYAGDFVTLGDPRLE